MCAKNDYDVSEDLMTFIFVCLYVFLHNGVILEVCMSTWEVEWLGRMPKVPLMG
jgi:hypothetical protein